MEIVKKEPVAYHYYCDGVDEPVLTHTKTDWPKASWWREVPLYEKAEWVGLTPEEEEEIITKAHSGAGWRFYIREAEAKLKEKNATN